MKPPVARRIPHDVSAHGQERLDDYHWLRDRHDPEVIAYLEAENAYAEHMLQPTAALRARLYEEMVARIQETDASVPARRDDYEYYIRTEKGRQYEIFCRRRVADPAAPEEILLDENALAEGRSYFHCGGREVSPDHRLLAYTVDTNGAESYELLVRDLATGTVVDGPIAGVSANVEWDNDSRALFYAVLDEQMRPWIVRRHPVGEPVADDAEVYREPDGAFYAGVEVSRSREYLFVSEESHTTTEVWYRRTGERGPLRVLFARRPEVEYHVAHSGDSFFILTNEDAFNFRVIEVPIRDPQRERGTDLIAHRPAVRIEGIDAFEHHLVVVEREEGARRIRVVDLRTRDSHTVPFEEAVHTVAVDDTPVFRTRTLRLSYSSLTTPRTIFDYDMSARQLVLRKRDPVLGSFKPEDYQSERVYASAVDGTRVPISLVYRKDVARDGTAPLLLYGYSAYGVSIEPHFVSSRLSLLDRGVIFAIAHARGGGALGRAWYERGKRLYKRNTFTDFLACAEYLIAKDYTSAGHIVCYGGSAGGLLIGTVVNMRPDLWRAAVAVVPFVDVLNTMLDETLPLTVIEYDEWGDPTDKKYYEYIRSYSPYDNIRRQEYPAMLVLGGFNDHRVQYWEPAKWVAKLRASKTDANPLILRTRMREGHKGASGRYDYLKDVALEYAWMLEQWGKNRVP
jgi:oligopeptidase B